MKRFVILTVGKTHSGKTTFARALERQLDNSLVIDQDNHAEFLNTWYMNLLPKQGPNTIKYAITQIIVDYAVHHTPLHLILCNSNRSRKGRSKLLASFHQKGFGSILVHFDIPDSVLQQRVAASGRSKAIFRTASTFEEVLLRQQAESDQGDILAPTKDEANHLFTINQTGDVASVIGKIVSLVLAR